MGLPFLFINIILLLLLLFWLYRTAVRRITAREMSKMCVLIPRTAFTAGICYLISRFLPSPVEEQSRHTHTHTHTHSMVSFNCAPRLRKRQHDSRWHSYQEQLSPQVISAIKCPLVPPIRFSKAIQSPFSFHVQSSKAIQSPFIFHVQSSKAIQTQ